MVTFSRNQIVSSSQFVGNFASFLKRMATSTEEKIAVVKNNQMQAVLISIDEYERLKAIEEASDQKEIAQILAERKNTPKSEYISFDDAMKIAGV